MSSRVRGVSAAFSSLWCRRRHLHQRAPAPAPRPSVLASRQIPAAADLKWPGAAAASSLLTEKTPHQPPPAPRRQLPACPLLRFSSSSRLQRCAASQPPRARTATPPPVAGDRCPRPAAAPTSGAPQPRKTPVGRAGHLRPPAVLPASHHPRYCGAGGARRATAPATRFASAPENPSCGSGLPPR